MKIRHTNKGFTLVEIIIVVAIIGILASVALPNLLRARVNANDGAIRADLRTFSTASESYRAVQSPPAYAQTIATLTGTTPEYIDETWASSPKHGYTTAYAVAADPADTYAILATPVAGAGGDVTYCVDQTGVLVGGTAGVTAPATGCVGGVPVSS